MIYKQIPQYPAYEVSECGTVVRRISNRKEVKQGFQMIKGKSSGYLYCTMLWDETDKHYIFPSKRIAVHRLVAFAWLDEPKEGQIWINHKDGIKSHNHRLNLEWTSISENIQHAHDTGLVVKKTGAEHWKYGTKQSIDAKKLMSDAKKGAKHPKFKGYYFVNYKRFESATQASKHTGIPTRTIINRCNNPAFKSKGYYFVPKETASQAQLDLM